MLKSILPAAMGATFLLVAASAGAENLKLRCTNAASGAAWDIAIDLDNKRVDDQPAEIDAKSINWRDPATESDQLNRPPGLCACATRRVRAGITSITLVGRGRAHSGMMDF